MPALIVLGDRAGGKSAGAKRRDPNDFAAREIWRADRFLRGGDQESFQVNGFPAIRFVESNENFTHQHQNVRIENLLKAGDGCGFIRKRDGLVQALLFA